MRNYITRLPFYTVQTPTIIITNAIPPCPLLLASGCMSDTSYPLTELNEHKFTLEYRQKPPREDNDQQLNLIINNFFARTIAVVCPLSGNTENSE